MLKVKDKIFVRELISYNELSISKENITNLTEDDVSKIRLIYHKRVAWNVRLINWDLIKKITESQICHLFKYLFNDIDQLYTFLTREYDIEEFVEEIAVNRYKCDKKYIMKMIKVNYTIEQIKFLLENEILFDEYHSTFDYYDYAKKVSKMGFDETKENVNACSIHFLESIRNLYSIPECYVLIKAKKIYWEPEDEFLKLIKFLYDKKFSAYEIFTLISLEDDTVFGTFMELESLKEDLDSEKKTKNEILQEYIDCFVD